MDDKANSVRRLFTDISRIYDRMNAVMSLGMDRRWRKQLVRLARVRPGARVLDVCSGTGEVALEAARVVGPAGKVVALDFCAEMLSEARAKVDAAALSGVVTLEVGDALSLPFPEASFDAVTVAFGVRNLSDIPLGFREMHRVLRPGGVVACLDLSRPSMPVFRQLYGLYFEVLVPFVGKLAHGRRGPYDYLPASLKSFPAKGRLADIMMEAGFGEVSYAEFACGTVVIHSGVKV